MPDTIHITTITAAETWPIRHVAMWPDRSPSYVQLEQDAEGLHLGLYEGDRIVSVISAFIDGETAQFRKFATLPDYQGRGLGSRLLTTLLTQLIDSGVQRIWCNARVERTGYYHRFGLVETGERFTRGGRDYVIMEKIISR